MSDEKEPVGSVAEEAAKLLGALQDWARESSHESAGAAAGAASAFKNLNEHIATGGKDCKYCPVCQLISVVRQTSPEVKQHLERRGLVAAAGALCSPGRPYGATRRTRPSASVEKIDLSDDAWDDV